MPVADGPQGAVPDRTETQSTGDDNDETELTAEDEANMGVEEQTAFIAVVASRNRRPVGSFLCAKQGRRFPADTSAVAQRSSAHHDA